MILPSIHDVCFIVRTRPEGSQIFVTVSVFVSLKRSIRDVLGDGAAPKIVRTDAAMKVM